MCHKQVIKGVCAGVVLALCVALLIYLVGNNPMRARKILMSFIHTRPCVNNLVTGVPSAARLLVGTEVRLALSTAFEVAFFLNVSLVSFALLAYPLCLRQLFLQHVALTLTMLSWLVFLASLAYPF